MIQRVLRYVMLGVAVVVLTACGGGGSNESNIKEGFFSKVVGLSYETSSGQKGVTDERGVFKYKEGDSITFSLNEVTIGTTDAKETISVFDFKNATVISQFLDSLDSDKDLSNGIDLSYFADSISSVRQTKMYKPSSLLEATVQDDRIQFNLEKVTAYDKRYIDFLKRNNANIFPGVKSTTEKFMQEVESKIQILQTDVYANSAKGIVIGKNIPMKAYFRDRPNIQETVEALYSSKKYDYRIMLAALNRIYNQGLYELAERNANVLENAEDRKKITDDMITKVGVGFDVTYQVMDATLDGDFKALAASKTYADYQVDTSTLPDGYKPALKLATTVTYDCLTARDKKSCMLNSAANGIALYSETVLSEDYPVLAATLSDGSGTAAGIVNMWIDCSKVESSFNNAKACVQDMFKEGTINSLKLTTTIAQIGLLTTDAKKVNNAKVALEAFVVKHLVAENDTCQAVGYYDQDKQEECEKETDESEKLERLFEAIQKAEILDIQDVIGLNVSDSDVLVEYEKLEKKYPKIKDIYSKAFAQYAKQDGTIDETKIEEALKSYVDFKIDTVSPSVEANSNGSYKLNITTCMQLESDIVLSNEVFVLKLIDEFQTVQYFELDPYTTIIRGTKKVCGVLQNVQLNGSSNFITGTKVHPFLIDAKFSYSIQNSLDGFTHELTDRVLNEGRLIQGDKSSVQIVDAYKGDKTYHLHATVPNDIRANASGKYSYHWVLETPGCSKVEYDGVELDYKVCNDRIALAKVSVFDAVTNEFVVTESKSLQPGLTLIPQGENSFEVSGSEFVYTKNGESSTYNFTVLGRDNYSVSFSMDDGLTKSASTPNSVTIVAKNTTSETIERVLTISVTSNKETVSKKVIFKIQPSSTPVVSRETISYKKSLETYPQANPGETIVKKWGLLNISDHTIKQVYLQWNPQKSYSGLIHQKRIDLGDVRPFDLSLNQSLQIVIPEALQGTHHFGYFDVYYTKEDGTTEKLLYSDGREASVIYNIDVEKKDTVPAVVPIIENTSIYAIDHIVYGTFEVLQNDNKQIKHLRVHFSTDTYFRENNSYVDVGGDYESLQDDGFKSFQFDASLYAGKKLYWKIECVNEDGLSLQYIPSGIVDIINSVNVPDITLDQVTNDGGLENEIFTFIANLSEPLADEYQMKVSLGDNSGGWLEPLDMIEGNHERTKFAKALKITQAGKDDGLRKYRVAIFNGDTQVSAWQEGTYRVYSSSEASNAVPTAVAKATPTTVTEGESITFDASESNDSDGQIVSYAWKEGNTLLSTEVSFTEVNLSVGDHTITLTVTDDDNATDSDSIEVEVRAYESNPPSITNLSISEVGSSEGKVKLTFGVDDNGSALTELKAHCATSTDYQENYLPQTLSTSDREVILQQDAWVGRTVYCKIGADNDGGHTASNTVSLQLSVENQPPVAVIDGWETNVSEGEAIVLIGYQSHDDGHIVKYEWKEDSTLLSSEQNLSRTDLSIGIHTITLTVTDDANATGSTSIVVEVCAADKNNTSPTAIAKATPATVTEGESITFDASESNDSDGQIVSYAWKEGNTLLSTEVSFTEDNLSVGDHTITLIVTDDANATDSTSVTVTVNSAAATSTQVKKTGQTKSYDTDGNEVTDGSLKDDGYYQKGVDPSYTRDDDKEVVVDNLTGLMWQDNADVASVTKQWLTDENYDICDDNNSAPECYDTSGDTATSYCENLELGGYSDWRLPTSKELEGIVDYGRTYPSIDTSVFQHTSSRDYWSSTTREYGHEYAWGVYFYYGGVGNDYKDDDLYVRCVRDGQ